MKSRKQRLKPLKKAAMMRVEASMDSCGRCPWQMSVGRVAWEIATPPLHKPASIIANDPWPCAIHEDVYVVKVVTENGDGRAESREGDASE